MRDSNRIGKALMANRRSHFWLTLLESGRIRVSQKTFLWRSCESRNVHFLSICWNGQHYSIFCSFTNNWCPKILLLILRFQWRHPSDLQQKLTTPLTAILNPWVSPVRILMLVLSMPETRQPHYLVFQRLSPWMPSWRVMLPIITVEEIKSSRVFA